MPVGRRAWAACAGALLLLGGAAQAQRLPKGQVQGQTPERGGVLVYAVAATPPNNDCEANFSFVANHVLAPEYSTLLKFSTADYPQIVGDLAQSWTVSPDRKTYTFKLHPNVLFHDGTHLTSADIKATYERIINPPSGVISVRQADYAGIASIDTPDPFTAVFHLRWPDAAALANFASPWNCIYSEKKLQDDPLYPKVHVMGSGPFVFVSHVKGGPWVGRRFNRYFRAGHPYLDGIKAEFISGPAVIKAMESGRVMAQFRSFTSAQRDELVRAMGDRVRVYESPWNINLLIVFNARRPPFNDPRVRRALSLAIDRWKAADVLSRTTFMKYVGGLMRPGTPMSVSQAALEALPGFSRDIGASRREAKRLLAEAGVPHLAFTLTNRGDVPIPYGPAGDYLVKQWAAIGVHVTLAMRSSTKWQEALEQGKFQAALDFGADYFDDPTIQLARYISRDLSPLDHSGVTDRFLDSLFIGQAITPDMRKRVTIVRAFEKEALTSAATVPLLWWSRTVVLSAHVHGWYMSPSHYIGQDLGDVWLDNAATRAARGGK